MRVFPAVIKKEIIEQARTGKLAVLAAVFVLLGVMNAAVAKATPWLLSLMADSMAGSGLTFTAVPVTALDAWTQFFKNMPVGLIVFVLLESGILTREVQTGTLLLSLTKGLSRGQAVSAKTAVLAALWTVCFWLCFGITYGYSAFYWDNAAAQNLLFSGLCWWVFGLWTAAVMILFSAMSGSGTGVLLGTGGAVLACVLAGMFPLAGRALPTMLTDGQQLIYGIREAKEYIVPLAASALTAAGFAAAANAVFSRRQL